jgi:hypothetical protein
MIGRLVCYFIGHKWGAWVQDPDYWDGIITHCVRCGAPARDDK